MKVNLGSLDRITRAAAGSVLLVLGLMIGGLAIVIALVGAGLILTGVTASCPIYARLGLSTFPRR